MLDPTLQHRPLSTTPVIVPFVCLGLVGLAGSAAPAGFLQQRHFGVNLEGAAAFVAAPQSVWDSISSSFSAVRFDATWAVVESQPAEEGGQPEYNFTLCVALQPLTRNRSPPQHPAAHHLGLLRPASLISTLRHDGRRRYDALVARCAANRVTPYVILDYDNPGLFGGCPLGQCLCQPEAAAAFVRFSLATMARYRYAAVFELWVSLPGRGLRVEGG